MRLVQQTERTKAPELQAKIRASARDAADALRPNPTWQSLALRPTAIQTKLSLTQSYDPYEQEADRVADRIMRVGDPPGLDTHTASLADNNRSADKLLKLSKGTQPVIQRKPDPKPAAATVDNVDDLYGALTEDLAKQAFNSYGGALTGNEKDLIAAFKAEGLSGWLGLAIIKQESSFANKENNPDIDERNVANPFSVHFNTNLKAWPKGCGKNLLLKEEGGKEYKPSKDVKKECAATGFRLPTFGESAQASAKTMAKLAQGKKGIDAYREEGGYKKDLNARLNEILTKIKAKRK